VLAQLLSNRAENLNHAQILNLGVLVLGLWATMALIYLFIATIYN
jgi:ribose 5-phosphate isomerase RpiB